MSRSSLIFGLLLSTSLWSARPVLCQLIEVPLNAPPAQAQGQNGAPKPPTVTTRIFDAQHLKDRPYTGELPKPAFPSTDRVQRSFSVAFVYDYAYSAYTPVVDLPVVPRGQAKRDTPEAAAIAYYSAQRNGDWDAFMQCWTEEDKKRIQDMIQTKKITVADLMVQWKQTFGNKPIELVDRLETIGYVILDARIPGASPVPLPAVFKLVKGEWLVSNDLGEAGNPLFAWFRPDLAGFIEHVQPVPLAQLGGIRKQEAQAESEFLAGHAVRDEVDLPGQ
jgi:hypothetical protein